MLDEVAALAHKLGDVFDVSGLFMLVRLNGNIQLVARSTSASIDVAKIAERFGGGGHSRAAAALIRDGDLTACRPQLIAPCRIAWAFIRSRRSWRPGR